ncbi:hypothetical protein ACYOEI_13645, partial [Singulisphaera rosea]
VPGASRMPQAIPTTSHDGSLRLGGPFGGRHRGNEHQGNGHQGVVTKFPHFYEAYTGPKLAELNAVKASAMLSSDGNFTFTGTNLGKITSAPAVYVWGIDRNGNLPDGPFTGRPNIKFDAVVVVTLDSSLHATAKVTDLTTGKTTALPDGSAFIHGRTVAVTVPASLLPSTGLDPAHYRFNYWPEDGGPPTSSSIASFAPEFTTAQVGVSNRR